MDSSEKSKPKNLLEKTNSENPKNCESGACDPRIDKCGCKRLTDQGWKELARMPKKQYWQEIKKLHRDDLIILLKKQFEETIKKLPTDDLIVLLKMWDELEEKRIPGTTIVRKIQEKICELVGRAKILENGRGL